MYRRCVRAGGGAYRDHAVTANTYIRVHKSQDPCSYGRDARAAARGEDESEKKNLTTKSTKKHKERNFVKILVNFVSFVVKT